MFKKLSLAATTAVVLSFSCGAFAFNAATTAMTTVTTMQTAAHSPKLPSELVDPTAEYQKSFKCNGYPWDWMKDDPAFKKSYTTMIESSKALKNEPWAATFGVSGEGECATLDNVRYVKVTGCEPHNCGWNMLHIVYNLKTKKSTALLVNKNEDDEVQTYIGKPSADERLLLDSMDFQL